MPQEQTVKKGSLYPVDEEEIDAHPGHQRREKNQRWTFADCRERGAFFVPHFPQREDVSQRRVDCHQREDDSVQQSHAVHNHLVKGTMDKGRDCDYDGKKAEGRQ